MISQHFLMSLCVNIVTTARILCIYPLPFYSHQIIFKIFTDELAKEGHQLVVMTPYWKSEPSENITIIDVEEVSNNVFERNFLNKKIKSQNYFSMDQALFMENIQNASYETVDAQFSDPQMRKLIEDKSRDFDLILIEDCIRMCIAITVRFKTKVISLSSMNSLDRHFHMMGAETNPLFFPDRNGKREWSSILSFWNKIDILYTNFVVERIRTKWEDIYNVFVRKHFGENAPSFHRLKNNIDALFINVDHIWDNNRPITPAVIYMGGMHLKIDNVLSEDLKKFLDNSQRGVVYISLGSKIKSSELPSRVLHVIINVFASLPYDIIWKWDGNDIPNKPSNILLQKWVPQNALLHHPSIKVFVTQAGLQSTDEAILAGVPLIGLPVFGDQYLNAAKFKQFGIGVQLDIDNLNEKDFRIAIIEVSEERRYRDNVVRLSAIMKDHRTGALQRTLHMVDYVRKFGAKHLHSPLASVSNAEYYMLDIFIPLTIVIVIVVITICYIIKQLLIYKLYLFLQRNHFSLFSLLCFVYSIVSLFVKLTFISNHFLKLSYKHSHENNDDKFAEN